MIIKCQGYKNVFRLHHKHFDCNYGAMHVPLDWLLGTYAGSKEEVMMIEILWRSFDSGNIFRFPRCGATSPRAWRPTRRRYTQRARNRTKWNKSKVISNQSTNYSIYSYLYISIYCLLQKLNVFQRLAVHSPFYFLYSAKYQYSSG